MAARVMAAARAEGLIVRAVPGDAIAICPPLIITDDEINSLFDRLQRALNKVHSEL